MQTKAFRVRVAYDACSAHHKGTLTNLSAPFGLARTGQLRLRLLSLSPVLVKEIEHVGPELQAALITVAVWVSHDSGFGSQLIRSSWIGVEHNARCPSHYFFHQSNVGLDLVDWCLDHHGVMDLSNKSKSTAMRPDAGNTQNISASRLHRKVAD